MSKTPSCHHGNYFLKEVAYSLTSLHASAYIIVISISKYKYSRPPRHLFLKGKDKHRLIACLYYAHHSRHHGIELVLPAVKFLQEVVPIMAASWLCHSVSVMLTYGIAYYFSTNIFVHVFIKNG